MVAAQRWPVHPPPLPDETLSSWLTRIARANASSLASWIVRFSEYPSKTIGALDTAGDTPFHKQIAAGTGIVGGVLAVDAMTFRGVMDPLHRHCFDRWMLSVKPLATKAPHGFCAVCLASDPTPYLRRAWRMEWLRWCPVHAVRMEWGCRACGAKLAPWRQKWDRPFLSCWSCGRDIARSSSRRKVPEHCAPPRIVADAVRTALPVVLGEAINVLPYVNTPLPLVWSLQRFAERAPPSSWPTWLGELGYPDDRARLPPSRGDALAWSFAIGWHLTMGPQERVRDFVLRDQAAFNRATSIQCPPQFEALRRPVHVPRDVTVEVVEEVVATLVEDDRPVTLLAVAEALSISPDRVGDTAAFRALVERAGVVMLAQWRDKMRARLSASRDRLRVQGVRLSRAKIAADAGVSLEILARYERETGETFAVSPAEEYPEMVRRAVAALQARGERVSTMAVARELGRERSFIEKRRDIKEIVAAARQGRPTVDDVRRACGVLRERGEQVTVLGVARLLGCGRHVIERSTPLDTAVFDARTKAGRVSQR